MMFSLPPGQWVVALDTSGEAPALVANKPLQVPAHALVLMRDDP
jgi:hypothetical protein